MVPPVCICMCVSKGPNLPFNRARREGGFDRYEPPMAAGRLTQALSVADGDAAKVSRREAPWKSSLPWHFLS